jgi:hypothetical protein
VRRRRLLLGVGAALAIVGLLAALVALVAPSDRVTFANYRKVEQGMTEAEVGSLLGGRGVTTYREGPGRKHLIWAGPRANIQVWFDGHGRVVSKVFSERSGGID